MRRRFLFALLCALALPAAAQQDPLAALQARLAGYQVIHAEFTQRKEIAAMKRPLISGGRVLISRERGVLWQLEQPLKIGYLLAEDRVVEIAADGTRRTRSAQDQPGLSHVARIFRALLNAQSQDLNQYFDARAVPVARGWEVELKPRQPQLAQYLTSIRLSGDAFVESIRIDEASGDRSVIEFKNSRGAQALDAADLLRLGAS